MLIKLKENVKLFIIPDLHEHKDQFDNAIEYIKPSHERIVVQLGDLYGKGFGISVAEYLADEMRKLIDQGFGYMIRGNHELKAIKKAKKSKQLTPQLLWLDKQPIVITFEFVNNTKLTVVHGGVTPRNNWDNLYSDVNTCYTRTVDSEGKSISLKYIVNEGKQYMVPSKEGGILWHNVYDNRFGYIASGHSAQADGVPKFYKYSCNLDASCYSTGKLFVQAFSENGREELLEFNGNARHNDVEEMHRLMFLGEI